MTSPRRSLGATTCRRARPRWGSTRCARLSAACAAPSCVAAGRVEEAEAGLREVLADSRRQGSYETGAVLLLLADLADARHDGEAARLREEGERHLAALGVVTVADVVALPAAGEPVPAPI